jgi:hypothetical protein
MSSACSTVAPAAGDPGRVVGRVVVDDEDLVDQRDLLDERHADALDDGAHRPASSRAGRQTEMT